MTTMWTLAVVLVLVVALLLALDRLALWAGSRNWIYYRNNPRKPGDGLGLLAKIYQPSLEHVVEEKASRAARAEQDESGEDAHGSHRDDDVPEDDPEHGR